MAPIVERADGSQAELPTVELAQAYAADVGGKVLPEAAPVDPLAPFVPTPDPTPTYSAVQNDASFLVNGGSDAASVAPAYPAVSVTPAGVPDPAENGAIPAAPVILPEADPNASGME